MVPTLCCVIGFIAGCTFTAVLLDGTNLVEHSLATYLFRSPNAISVVNQSKVFKATTLPRPLKVTHAPQFATRLSGTPPNSTLLMTRPIGLLPPAWCTLSALEGGGQLDGSEQKLIAKYVNNATRGYFEWGTGASTLRALRSGIQHGTAVDTDQRALDYLLGHPSIINAASTRKLDLFYVDIDADGSGGGKPDGGHKGGRQRRRFAYPDVSDVIRHHPNPHLIDAVLVDGRFRAACVLKAASVVRNDTPIMLHDAYRDDCESCLACGIYVAATPLCLCFLQISTRLQLALYASLNKLEA